MPYFKYTGINKLGEKVNGIHFGEDAKYVKDILNANNILAESISEIKTPALKIKSSELTEITDRIATLISSGFQLNDALNFIERNTTNIYAQEIFHYVDKMVKEGKSFAEALMKYPNIFNKLYIGMIKVGEKNGIIDTVMSDLAKYLEKKEENRKEIINALTYPLIMVAILILSLVVVLFFIVPQFSTMLESLHVDLPLATKLLLGFSNWLKGHWIEIFSATALIIFGIRKLFKTQKFKSWWDIKVLSMPLFGDLILKQNLLNFIGVMKLSLERGMEFIEAFGSSKDVITNSYLLEIFNEIRQKIITGSRIGIIFDEYSILPQLFREMLKVGDESGNLTKVLEKLNDTYEKEINIKIKSLLNLIEPIITVVMGLVIGGIVAAIMLPMLEAAGQMH